MCTFEAGRKKSVERLVNKSMKKKLQQRCIILTGRIGPWQRVLNGLLRTRVSRLRKVLPPPLSRQQVVSLLQSSCVSPFELTGGRGGRGGEGGSQIIGPRESLVLYYAIKFSEYETRIGIEYHAYMDQNRRGKGPSSLY
jgi:hypothetical protein